MKRKLFFPLLLVALFAGPFLPLSRAAQPNEEHLIGILESPSASLREKSGALAELKRAGTDRCVKAVAQFLMDQQLSHSARHVLESLPGKAAGEVLREALGQTSGPLKVGIIDSLAVRRESAATPDLGRLLTSSDQAVAAASAEALGRIGTSACLKILQASVPTSAGRVHQAEVDALLTCANRFLEEGHDSKALKLFKDLYAGERAGYVREAAFGGMVQASGKRGIALVTDAIANGDPAIRSAALHVASRLKGAEATKALADFVISAKVPIQLALIECLVQRNDPAAMPSVVRLADSTDASVRLAAITALGSLGDDSVVRLLGEKAAGVGAERDAARQSLLEVNRGQVTSRMLALLSDPSATETQSELIRALGARADQSAIPDLLALARRKNKNERQAALQALGQLADATQISALVQMVADASTDETRSDAVGALDATIQRVPARANPDMTPLAKAVTSGSVDTRLVLLPVCSEVADRPVRVALRAGIADQDSRIRDTAIHAVCETQDPELLPDLLDLATKNNSDTVRHLAVRAYVRLTTEEGVKISNADKLDALEQLLKTQLDTADKKLVLSGLAGIADQKALALASAQLDDAAVRNEAEQAVIHIASSIQGAHPAEAGVALKKVLALSTDNATRKSARNVLDKIH